jgi:2'-5' RNA ligase
VAEGDLRLFIAVAAPPEAIAACATLIDGVRASVGDAAVRWVRPEGLHVTLRFLGATAPARVDGLVAAMAAAAEGEGPFDVGLAGAGAFPSLARPRTVWIGIVDGAPRLGALAGRLAAPLAELGWPPEGRPFRPHLTVGRTRSTEAPARTAAEAVARAARDWRVAFRAEAIRLYRSHLGSGLARYEVLAEVPLAG